MKGKETNVLYAVTQFLWIIAALNATKKWGRETQSLLFFFIPLKKVEQTQ